MAAGIMPAEDMTIISWLCWGIMLIIPGFISDFSGLLLSDSIHSPLIIKNWIKGDGAKPVKCLWSMNLWIRSERL